MPERTTKLLCGACGGTGRIYKHGHHRTVCLDCDGVGYSEVIHADARTLDRIRNARQLGALRRFTAFIALLIGVGIGCALFNRLDNLTLALYLVGTSLLAYFVLRLPWLAAILRVTMNFLKVFIGFVVITGLIAGVTYLLFLLREMGGW